MRKRTLVFVSIVFSLLLGIGIFWRYEYAKYQKYTNSSLLSGTISTWKSGENFDENHFILLNPNDIGDYVEFDFSFVKKIARAEYINSIFFDGNGFYVLVIESFKTRKNRLFYLSSEGIDPIATNLVRRNGAFSGFIKSDNTLFIKLDQNLYKIDDRTKSLCKVKDFGTNEVWVYPYQNGIVYQSGTEVRFYSESGDKVLFHLPDEARFDGWFVVGKSVFVRMPHKITYVMDLATGALTLFSEFSYENLGNCSNGVLLMMYPKGGGGATPFDVDYTWSCLLGNDVLTAFTISVYNKDTGRIKNLYFSDGTLDAAWLDIPYDKERFEELRQGVVEMQRKFYE